MGKYWKSPKQKTWYQFIVDGKVVSIMPYSRRFEKERNRLKGLIGIEISIASYESLQRFNAKTEIPQRILSRMNDLYSQSKRVGICQ